MDGATDSNAGICSGTTPTINIANVNAHGSRWRAKVSNLRQIDGFIARRRAR
jgi:hypothetical protein